MASREVTDIPKYTQSECYRSFLMSFFRHRVQLGKPLTYGALAQACGFKSRSFIRDVVLGGKRLTPVSLPKLRLGLKLPADEWRLFELLVHRDEPELFGVKSSKARIDQLITLARHRAESKHRNDPILLEKQGLDLLFKEAEFPLIYAALGEDEMGSSTARISKMTGVQLDRCERILKKMLHAGVASRSENGNYSAARSHLVLAGFGNSESFKAMFLASLEFLRGQATGMEKKKQCLFQQTSFSIPSEKVSVFKSELQKLILDFVVEQEDPQGERIATIIVAGLVPDI